MPLTAGPGANVRQWPVAFAKTFESTVLLTPARTLFPQRFLITCIHPCLPVLANHIVFV